MTQNETDNYEAFDLVASALEELKLYEVSVRAHEAKEKKGSRVSAPANGENFLATSEPALNEARRYLEEALNETPRTSTEDQDPLRKADPPKGDEEYFKAHYLTAMTDYFNDRPDAAGDLFERILSPPKAPGTSAHRAAKKAHETADKAFLEEVRYNLGAAYFEQNKLGRAIAEFDAVIESTERTDLSLELLARSATALAHATRYQEVSDKGDSNRAWAEVREVNKQLRKEKIFLFRIRWRNGIILQARKIDQRTAHSIRRILNEVKSRLTGARGAKRVESF